MSEEIKPCPFCGVVPTFEEHEDHIGTQYEVYCECGLSCSCIQISDLMTIEEWETGWDDKEVRYHKEFFDRARNKAIENWNKRSV